MTIQDITSGLIIHLQQTTKLPAGCDLSDLGNEIGIAIGEHINKDKMGYELDSFIAGIKHGVSLVDGSH